MTTKTINSTIEILGKFYPVRCLESEVAILQEAAAYLNRKMQEIQASGNVINLERIAIIAALNITHEFLEADKQKAVLTSKINQRITHLQDKLDIVLNHSLQNEFLGVVKTLDV